VDLRRRRWRTLILSLFICYHLLTIQFLIVFSPQDQAMSGRQFNEYGFLVDMMKRRQKYLISNKQEREKGVVFDLHSLTNKCCRLCGRGPRLLASALGADV